MLIVLIITATGVFGATSTRDAASLAAQCSAKDWDTYMNCQLTLLEVRKAGKYCVPTPENAARYQYEFVAFMQRDLPVTQTTTAQSAAAEYFSKTYPCSGTAQPSIAE